MRVIPVLHRDCRTLYGKYVLRRLTIPTQSLGFLGRSPKQRFGYFAAEGKVTRAGARNLPVPAGHKSFPRLLARNLPRQGLPKERRPHRGAEHPKAYSIFSSLAMSFKLMVSTLLTPFSCMVMP